VRTLVDLRTIQRSVAHCDEFRDTTRFAMTSTYSVEVGKVDVQYNRGYLRTDWTVVRTNWKISPHNLAVAAKQFTSLMRQ